MESTPKQRLTKYFYTYGAYGGTQLRLQDNGSDHDVLQNGFMKKRELYDAIDIFIHGILIERNKGKQQ